MITRPNQKKLSNKKTITMRKISIKVSAQQLEMLLLDMRWSHDATFSNYLEIKLMDIKDETKAYYIMCAENVYRVYKKYSLQRMNFHEKKDFTLSMTLGEAMAVYNSANERKLNTRQLTPLSIAALMQIDRKLPA